MGMSCMCLVFVAQQVSQSVMAVVPEGATVSVKTRLKGSMVTAENVDRLNGEIQYVSVWLPVLELYNAKELKKVRVSQIRIRQFELF